MEISEFDRFANEYTELHKKNIAITGETPEYFAEYKIRTLKEIAGPTNLSTKQSILDFGSGIGNSIPYVEKYFASSELICADVSRRSLDLGRARFPSFGTDVLIEDAAIPIPADTVQLAFSACVFHHIPHGEHDLWLRELRRVVRPGGALVIFEHNPLNPLTVHAVNTCELDENAELIRARELSARCRAAGWSEVRTRYHVFFPRLLAALRRGERYLGWLPLGAQYSVECR
jgi:SAM-dependent methyltransferase